MVIFVYEIINVVCTPNGNIDEPIVTPQPKSQKIDAYERQCRIKEFT